MPRPKLESGKVRVTLAYPSNATKAGNLLNLQRLTGAASISETIRRAVTLHTRLVERADAGQRIILRRPDGGESELIIV